MDPDATLALIREALAETAMAADGDSNDDEIAAAHKLRDGVEALDEWLSKGGFLPAAWASELRDIA